MESSISSPSESPIKRKAEQGQLSEEIQKFHFKIPSKLVRQGKSNSPAGSSLSMQSDRTLVTNRSAESKKSFSAMSVDYVGECLGFDIVSLFNAQKERLDELDIRLRSDDLSELFNKLYNKNLERVQYRFPHSIVSETRKRYYVDDLFVDISIFITKKFGLDFERIHQETKLKLLLPLGEVVQEVEPDICIFEKTDSGKKYFLSVVECKTCLDDAVKQGLGYGKTAYLSNNDGKTFYVFATNSASFRVLSYNPTDKSAAKQRGFKMSKQFDYLFYGMHEERNREKWFKECTEIIRVIYAILSDKLGL